MLENVDWENDYIVQYIPITTPNKDAKEYAGKICSLVSIYPLSGETKNFAKPDSWKPHRLEKFNDSVMLREVFYFKNPPFLKQVYNSPSSLTAARGRLGNPTSQLYDNLSDLELYPVNDLYRSPVALQYLSEVVDKNESMQIVANRRTGKAGYVYALSLPQFPGALKIGSTYDVSSRISGLSTAIPVDFKLVADCFFDDCRKAERNVHSILEHCRIRQDREWFRCNIDEFYAVINKIQK